MDKATIDKLKELKQLVDDGILTQEEFEAEKKQILSAASGAQDANVKTIEVEEVATPAKPYRRNRFLDKAQPADKSVKEQQTTQNQKRRSPRTINIPLWDRSLVMNQSTPEDVIKKCDKKLLQGKICYGLGTALTVIFIMYCLEGGFWAILNAFVFALIPGVILLITGYLKRRYNDLKEKFVGMSQTDFEFVQETIRRNRAETKEAVITFANDFAEGVNQYATEYQQQTGSNFYSDVASGLLS